MEPMIKAGRSCRPRECHSRIAERGGAMRFIDETFYGEMRSAARRILSTESSAYLLDPTDLLNESLLRILSAPKGFQVANRDHLIAIGVITMRRVLVDYFRSGTIRVMRESSSATLNQELPATDRGEFAAESTSTRRALAELAQVDRRGYLTLYCRYFEGLSVEETAAQLCVCGRTVKRDSRRARWWLKRRLKSRSSCLPVIDDARASG